MKPKALVRGIVTITALLVLHLSNSATAAEDLVTQETLLDRIQIEDLMVQYYANMGEVSGEEMARYFVEDGVLDVNNMVFEGRDEIAEIYNIEDTETGEDYDGVVHTLVTNAIVNVEGDEATIWLIWTNVMNDNIRMAPRFLEQGRDYTELVKRDGRWLIEHRYVTTDGGAPAYWAKNYKHRTFR